MLLVGSVNVVSKDVSQPGEQGIHRLAPKGSEVSGGFEKGRLDDVGKVESPLESFIEVSLGDDVQVGTKTLQKFPFGFFVTVTSFQ